MKGYVFILGVDGFGEDTCPATEEGCYLNYNKAFQHLVELTKKCLADHPDFYCYEEGYGEDYFPDEDTELSAAYDADNWDLFDRLMQKHILKDAEAIAKNLLKYETPLIGFYTIKEIDIIE